MAQIIPIDNDYFNQNEKKIRLIYFNKVSMLCILLLGLVCVCVCVCALENHVLYYT